MGKRLRKETTTRGWTLTGEETTGRETDYTEEGTIQKTERDYSGRDSTEEELHHTKGELHEEETS